MIFVTVGTHEQPFNRLIEKINQLKKSGIINEQVIVQCGYSSAVPDNCTYKRFFNYDEMIDLVNKARIVITHGGPSSFILPLQIGKIPVVVPRQKDFGEHVNNHQLDFCLKVAKRYNNIIVVKDINRLENVIVNYDILSKNLNSGIVLNNQNFVNSFERIINNLFKEC